MWISKNEMENQDNSEIWSRLSKLNINDDSNNDEDWSQNNVLLI